MLESSNCYEYPKIGIILGELNPRLDEPIKKTLS